MQDDWKLSERLTVNLGLRYEVYVPDTEKEDRLPNYDPVAMELVYAGENADRHANKETRWGNLAPRFGLAWDMTGNAKNVLRAGYGRSFFPVPYAAGNLLDQNVPELDLAKLQRGDEPPRFLAFAGPAPVEPVPGHRAPEAAGHGRAQHGEPARVRPRLLQRDAAHGHAGR